ncbi:hypothetical protein BZG36_02821 [Bifiguratus adelaidae]|uniref:Calponin-homology (CH) domain-containing protein n=1 Tax=Bifiguratus adelaidae TaxID=1938954 RepID=A0A261Y0L3_9FUNG|nr:hypothetical protein BZG36_02821 [Bifiguratus adelaidae]
MESPIRLSHELQVVQDIPSPELTPFGRSTRRDLTDENSIRTVFGNVDLNAAVNSPQTPAKHVKKTLEPLRDGARLSPRRSVRRELGDFNYREVSPKTFATPKRQTITVPTQRSLKRAAPTNEENDHEAQHIPYKVKTSHPTLPYMVKNAMYDVSWMDKQELAFLRWLQYELRDEQHLPEDLQQTDSAVALRKQGRTLERYTNVLRQENARILAFKLYQSAPLAMISRTLSTAFETSHLRVKDDVDFTVDVGLRQQIFDDLLWCFDARWLSLGLETVTGRAINWREESFERETLLKFLDATFFEDKTLPVAPMHTQSNERKIWTRNMNRSIVRKILMLILFLDKAKANHLLETDPCLFKKESDIKATKDLLPLIASSLLQGEGDFVRHLMHMGYSLEHRQKPIDEYDFSVSNLAVDLTDGVRLCRLVEKHSKNWTLSNQLRFPVVSKSHQLHNVSIVLDAIREMHINIDGASTISRISAKDIVDGNREKIFALLWKLIIGWRVPGFLDTNLLKEELRVLKQEYRHKFGHELGGNTEHNLYFSSDHLSLLLQWCKTVCAFNNIPVRNFTNSFADGRAFCYLIGHYHPDILPKTLIEDSASYLQKAKEQGIEPLNPGGSWHIPSENNSDPVEEAKTLDRKNFRLLQQKVKELGGIPLIIRYADVFAVGIPDEKIVITFVSYLCSRLIHLSKEIRAARQIQITWRTFNQKRYPIAAKLQASIRGHLARKAFGVRLAQARAIAAERAEEQRRAEAARLEQEVRRAVIAQRTEEAKRHYLVLSVQQRIRRYLATKHSIVRMQRQIRGFLVRKQTFHKHDIVLRLQNRVRRYQRIKRRNIEAAKCIQEAWRGYIRRRETIALQAQVRRFIARSRLFRHLELLAEQQKEFALRLQSVLRARTAALKVEKELFVRSLQQCARTYLAWTRAAEKYNFIRHLQLGVREYLELKQLKLQEYQQEQERLEVLYNSAAFTIQSAWRTFVQVRAERRKRVTLALQTVIRQYLSQRNFSALYEAELRRQEEIIMQERRKREEALRRQRLVLAIQSTARGFLTREIYKKELRQREEALRREQLILGIQSTARGYLMREIYKEELRQREEAARREEMVLAIQSTARGYLIRGAYHHALRQREEDLRQEWVTVAIQSAAKGYLMRKLYLEALGEYRAWRAAVTLQSLMRGLRARLAFRPQQAALRIQSAWRAYLVKRAQGLRYRKMRRRIKDVNSRVEEHMKLSNRTEMALNMMMESEQMSAVLKACSHLEVVSRLSMICCRRLIDHGCVPIIFALVQSCNRSKPHMEVLKYAVHILENLGNHKETVNFLFDAQDGMPILIDTIQNYRENDEIFLCAANIIHLLSHADNEEYMKRIHLVPNVVKRVKMILGKKWATCKKDRRWRKIIEEFPLPVNS